MVGAVVSGRAEATLGLDLTGFGHAERDPGSDGRPGRDEVWAAWAHSWGVETRDAAPTIAVDRTVLAAGIAAKQLAAVCAVGGSVALATGRPASMLRCYQELARHLEAAGATVLRSSAAGQDVEPSSGRYPRSVWWLGGVGVVTDGRSILADDGTTVADDWLFGVGRPDLVVADRGFAAAAVMGGLPTVAPADLDAVALAVAGRRGAPVTTVPLDCGRPPEAYGALVGLLIAHLGALEPEVTGAPREERPPHSTTPAPGAYAAPESGGEG